MTVPSAASAVDAGRFRQRASERGRTQGAFLQGWLLAPLANPLGRANALHHGSGVSARPACVSDGSRVRLRFWYGLLFYEETRHKTIKRGLPHSGDTPEAPGRFGSASAQLAGASPRTPGECKR